MVDNESMFSVCYVVGMKYDIYVNVTIVACRFIELGFFVRNIEIIMK